MQPCSHVVVYDLVHFLYLTLEPYDSLALTHVDSQACMLPGLLRIASCLLHQRTGQYTQRIALNFNTYFVILAKKKKVKSLKIKHMVPCSLNRLAVPFVLIFRSRHPSILSASVITVVCLKYPQWFKSITGISTYFLLYLTPTIISNTSTTSHTPSTIIWPSVDHMEATVTRLYIPYSICSWQSCITFALLRALSPLYFTLSL